MDEAVEFAEVEPQPIVEEFLAEVGVMKYREALRAALDEEMERDPPVFVIGEGIGERGGSYKVTEGLLAKFGPNRVIDTPLSEAGFVGPGRGGGDRRPAAGGRDALHRLPAARRWTR